MRRRRLWVVLGILAVAGWWRGEAGAAAERTSAAGVARGAKLFQAECAGCHGAAADGKGVADPELQPRPRDLTSGKFKLRSTWARSPATNAEILATITRGIPGTSMPSFSFLAADERQALVEYVAAVGNLPPADTADPVDVPPEPPMTPKLLEQGKQLYADLGCAACHGDEGRGDGAAAPYLKDEWGSTTLPRNLISDPMKGGESNRDLYLRFAIGMPGTPMPSYADTVRPEELWALVLYLQSLRSPPPPPPKDPVAWGRQLVAQKHCAACHTGSGVKEGGGAVGPSLAVAAQVLDLDWLARYLEHPRAAGKLYPGIPYRMPDLGLDAAQANAVTAYLASLAGRKLLSASPTLRAPAAAELARGGVLWAEQCASCHQLGASAPTAPLEQQGPVLTRAAARYDADGVRAYLADPRKLDRRAVMKPIDLSPGDVQALLAFVFAGGR